MASLNIFNCANILLEEESPLGKDSVEKAFETWWLARGIAIWNRFFLDHKILASLRP